MFRSLVLSLGLWALTLSLGAQPVPEVVLLPVELPGYFTPVQSDQLSARLDKRLKKVAQNAELQLARRADLTAYAYEAGANQPPQASTAEQICRAYQANYLCWTSIRFQPRYDEKAHTLALAGAARVWIYSRSDGRVVLDEPLSLIRTGALANGQDRSKGRQVAQNLADGCVDDLGLQLAYLARQRRQQKEQQKTAGAWKAAPSVGVSPVSSNYREMVKAIQAYQKAQNSQNLMDITQAQQSMTAYWNRLNGNEQKAIENDYPGIVRLLNAPPIYPYWPYY